MMPPSSPARRSAFQAVSRCMASGDKVMSKMWIQPTGGALGADVHGIDLSQPLDEPTYKRIAAAWAEHLVLRFSGQKIDDAALMTFSARFGELDRVPIAAANFDRADSELDKDAESWVAVISS